MIRPFEQCEMAGPTLYEWDQRLRPFLVGVFVGKRLRCELVQHGIRGSYGRVEGQR